MKKKWRISIKRQIKEALEKRGEPARQLKRAAETEEEKQLEVSKRELRASYRLGSGCRLGCRLGLGCRLRQLRRAAQKEEEKAPELSKEEWVNYSCGM